MCKETTNPLKAGEKEGHTLLEKHGPGGASQQKKRTRGVPLCAKLNQNISKKQGNPRASVSPFVKGG